MLVGEWKPDAVYDWQCALSFAAPDTAKKAFENFKAGTCFRVQVPEFDGKLKSEYMSSSIKRALLLTKPTMISAVSLTDTDTLKGIADYVTWA